MEGLPPTGQTWWRHHKWKNHPKEAQQNLRHASIPARLAGGSGTTTTKAVLKN